MGKYSLEIAKEMFNEKGYDLVSTEYKSVTDKLNFICRRHPDKGVQQMTLKDLMKGSKCVYCKFEDGDPHNKPYPDDIVIQQLDKLNCDYVGRYVKNEKSIIQFVCRKHPWKGVQETSWNNIAKGMNICGVCNGLNRNTYDFKMMVKEINPNIEIISEYNGARKTVRCRCKIDGCEWETKADKILSGCGCPECGRRKIGDTHRGDLKQKIQKLHEMHPDIEFLTEPVLSTQKILCKCKICGHEWYATYTNLTKATKSTGCPHCTISKGEKKIYQLLQKWGYDFDTQQRYPDLYDERELPFDFILLDYNILIEYDGIQHYKIGNWSSSYDKNLEVFQKTIKHDIMKNEYCYDNNIPLIRIPYWHYDELEYYLFDELVKYKAIEVI